MVQLIGRTQLKMCVITMQTMCLCRVNHSSMFPRTRIHCGGLLEYKPPANNGNDNEDMEQTKNNARNGREQSQQSVIITDQRKSDFVIEKGRLFFRGKSKR